MSDESFSKRERERRYEVLVYVFIVVATWFFSSIVVWVSTKVVGTLLYYTVPWYFRDLFNRYLEGRGGEYRRIKRERPSDHQGGIGSSGWSSLDGCLAVCPLRSLLSPLFLSYFCQFLLKVFFFIFFFAFYFFIWKVSGIIKSPPTCKNPETTATFYLGFFYYSNIIATSNSNWLC